MIVVLGIAFLKKTNNKDFKFFFLLFYCVLLNQQVRSVFKYVVSTIVKSCIYMNIDCALCCLGSVPGPTP